MTPTQLEALARKHGATSYRNRADTQHPAYGFSEAGLEALVAELRSIGSEAVVPLVKMLVNALETASDDSREVLSNYQQLYSERFRPQRLKWQEGVCASNDKALAEAKAWLAAPSGDAHAVT